MSMRSIVMIEQNVKDKEKNLKSYKKKKRQITYKGMPVEPTADFSLIAIDDRDREVIS